MDKNIFPGWEIMEELGAGAFSTVYKIRKTDGFGADYFSALKVISIPNSKDEYNQYRDEGYTEEEISKLFEQQTQSVTNEFKVLSAFKGAPNIVSFDDYRVQQKANGIGWDVLIRMELLTALPNAYKSSPLTVEDTVKLGTDICNALILCEQKNIIHRDIKPQNIFVSEFGDYKLGDFGIARNMDHTTRATKIGTPAYMAPEVFHGNAYNNTADIYSLGMVLYWLLNERRMPFLPLPPQMPTAEQTSAAHTKRLSCAPLPPPKNGTDALKQAVLKACAFDPKQRYTTAKEFKAALAASLAAPVVHTAPTAPIAQDIEATVAVRKAPLAQDIEKTITAPTTAKKQAKPQKAETHTENLATLMVHKAPPTAEAKQKKKWPFALLGLLLVLGVGLGLYFILYGGKKDADNKTENSSYTALFLEDSASSEISTQTESSVFVEESSLTESQWEDSSVPIEESSKTEESSNPPQTPSVKYDLEGTTANGLKWTMLNGTLTISGNGPLENTQFTVHENKIKKVVIKSGVTSIGDQAFSGCTALTNATIPGSVKSIGDYAFSGCDSLTSITIPNSVKSIGDRAFSGCIALASVTIPNSVTSIGDWAFRGCNSLTSITIPDSVTNIGDYAFSGCTALTSITIPGSVTSIGDYAFSGCTSLASITIPNSVKSIGDYAFRWCTSLTSITIPNSVTSIGDWAFEGCKSLKSVNYKGTKAQWAKVSLGSDWKSGSPFTVVHCTDGDVAV